MNIRYFMCAILSLMLSISAIAQEKVGAAYIDLDEIGLAKKYLNKDTGAKTAGVYYLLGEIAFIEGNMDEAKANYKKGLELDPLFVYNGIGLAKVDLKTNTKVAEDQLSLIQKQNKKDILVVLAIAEAYADNGMKEKMDAKVADARKIDKKSPYLYMFEGERLEKANKIGDGAAQFDQAIAFDPKFVLAYVKGAKVYETINPTAAISLLKKAAEIEPNYMIIYKYLGKIYSNTGFFTEGIEAYKKWFTTGDQTADDIKWYAGDEYYFKNYENVKKLAQDGLKLEPDNFALNRLLMYSESELGEYATAMATAQKFFSIPRKKDANYLQQDYIAYAKILSENGQKPQAIEQYKKAIASDSTKIELDKEVAAICADENMPVEAAQFFKSYVTKAGAAAGGSDYFQLGRYYTTAGNSLVKSEDPAEKEKAKENYLEADQAFAKVSELAPDSHLGYLFRARTNFSLDPETTQGLAKPYYEKVIELALAKEDGSGKDMLIESYNYMAYYYYLQFVDITKAAPDKEKVKEFSGKVLELDPENKQAKQFNDFAKQ